MHRSRANVAYMLDGARKLSKEFQYRFGKMHASSVHLEVLEAAIAALPDDMFVVYS